MGIVSLVRTTHETSFVFPDREAAENAAKAWCAATKKSTKIESVRQLSAMLSQLEDAASLRVRRRDRIVQLEVTLHDDLDAWASDGGPTTDEFWAALFAIGTELRGQREGAVGAEAAAAIHAIQEQDRLRFRLAYEQDRPLVWLPETYGQSAFGIDPASRRLGDLELTAFIERLRSAGGLRDVPDDAIRSTLANENHHGDPSRGVDVPTLSYHVLLLDPRFEAAAPAPWNDDHVSWAARVLALSGVEPSELESDFVRPKGFVIDVTLGDEVYRLNHGRESLRDADSRRSVLSGLNALAESCGLAPDYSVFALNDCDSYAVGYLPVTEREPLSTAGIIVDVA